MTPTQIKFLRVLSIILALMAVLTLIPYGASKEAGIMGYRSLCPFAPVSTIISLYLSLTIHRYLGNKRKARL